VRDSLATWFLQPFIVAQYRNHGAPLALKAIPEVGSTISQILATSIDRLEAAR
jgi:hypothetical protein